MHDVQVTEHTSFEGVHKYQINSLKFIPGRDSMSLLTACCLGHTCLTDIETGMHRKVVDLNPEVPISPRGCRSYPYCPHSYGRGAVCCHRNRNILPGCSVDLTSSL